MKFKSRTRVFVREIVTEASSEACFVFLKARAGKQNRVKLFAVTVPDIQIEREPRRQSTPFPTNFSAVGYAIRWVKVAPG